MTDSFHDQLTRMRRDHIMDAAVAVIAEQGFPRTTIKQIAQKAGVADGTIYNYFKNKEAILLGIVARLSNAEMREIDFAVAQKIDFQTFVTGYVTQRMQELDEQQQTFQVILPETIVNTDISRQIYEQIYAPGFAIAEQYFQQLIDDGTLPADDPALLARLFASPLLGLLLLRLLGDEHVAAHWDRYSQALIQQLLKFTEAATNGDANETA